MNKLPSTIHPLLVKLNGGRLSNANPHHHGIDIHTPHDEAPHTPRVTDNMAQNMENQTHMDKTQVGKDDEIDLLETHTPPRLPLDNSETWGDPILKTHSSCRILMQNINGLQDKTHHLGARAHELNIDIMGIVETNTDWSWKDTKSTITSTLRRYFSRTTFSVSQSNIKFDSIFQPGGTLSVATNKWSTRTSTSCDPRQMGRWSEITLTGKLEHKVTIFSVYRVCDQSFATSGPKTAYRQQYIMQHQQTEERLVDPRLQVLLDLETAINAISTDQHAIIVLIDANESTMTYQSRLASWITRLSLVDPLTSRHGHADQPSSILNGSMRIDYILTSRPLAPFVQATGILPHDFIVPSDHRPLYLDIDLERFLKGLPYDNISHSSRGIHSDNPKAVKRYQQLLTKALGKTHIEEDLLRLSKHQDEHGHLTPRQQEQAKQIDRNLSNIKLACEAKCRHIIKTPWSPELIKLQNLTYFWASWIRQLKSSKDNTAFRTRICPDMPLLIAPSNDIVKVALRSARHAFKAALRKAATLRTTHMTELASLYANSGRSSVGKIVAQIQKREEMRIVYQRCHHALHRPTPKPITHILVPSPGGTQHTISDQLPMEAALTARNHRHFSQADGTPFTRSPIKTIFGPNGINSPTKALLNGTIDTDISSLPEATQMILQNIPLGNVTPIDHIIHVEELMQSYKRWRESTSTSPFGDHLGHEKAILRKITPANPTDDQTTALDHRMFTMKAQLLNLAIANRIVYDRWKVVINTMIEKIKNKPLIDKFRVIHIIPADLNMTMGTLFGYRMMIQAEELKQLGEEQSGSRKNKDCQDVQHLKHCIFSIVRLSRAHGSTFDNDAKSCFDRIVMLLPSILAQRLGMPPQVCDLFLTTLSQIHYKTKTIHGISETSYTTSTDHTIHGPGQGSRAAPGTSGKGAFLTFLLFVVLFT